MPPKAKAVRVAVALAVVENGGAVALVAPGAAPSPFNLEGLWELPGTRLADADAASDTVDAAVDAALRNLARGAAPRVVRREALAKPLSHSITSTRYVVHVRRVSVADPAGLAVEWVPVAALSTKGTSSVVGKAVTAALAPPKPAKKPAKKRKRAAAAPASAAAVPAPALAMAIAPAPPTAPAPALATAPAPATAIAPPPTAASAPAPAPAVPIAPAASATPPDAAPEPADASPFASFAFAEAS